MDILTGLAAVSQGLDAVKKLRDLEKDFDAATFRLEIANLTVALADARVALAEAQTTIQDRDAEIRRLTEVANNKAPSVFYQNFNFGIGPDGQAMGLPFCPACEKTKGLQIQIAHLMDEFYKCPVCEALYSSPPLALPSNLIPTR